MTNEDILNIALGQSAVDCSCEAGDFLKTGHTVARSRRDECARRYLELPHVCNFVTYGNGVVASAGEKYMDPARRCLELIPPGDSAYRLFETPIIHGVDAVFAPLGARTMFMTEYFLPDMELLRPKKCPLETKILTHDDFSGLYLPEWSNALSSKRPQLDVLGVGAYDGGRLVGLAGCSADCESMWQIGIDVLPEYRRRGVASALVSRLALEVTARGKVPFYCAAWSNVRSVRTAISAGFRPAWVELTLRPEAGA